LYLKKSVKFSNHCHLCTLKNSKEILQKLIGQIVSPMRNKSEGDFYHKLVVWAPFIIWKLEPEGSND